MTETSDVDVAVCLRPRRGTT